MQRRAASAFSIIVLFFMLAIPAYAQVGTTSADPLTTSLDPQYPAPYQTVNVTPSSNVFDIQNSSISVTVNGVSVYKGSGGQAVPVTVGGPGTATTIVVTATTAGHTYTDKTIIRPASVALVVEPVTTTHPFYGGKSLVSAASRVRVVAIADVRSSTSTALPASSLVYTWRLGNQVLESASGIGKNVLDASAPQKYRDAAISVTVSTQDGSISAVNSTSVNPVDPILRIYRNDPLMGPLFDTALSGSVTMTDTEETYRGIAYYFANPPALTWTVNNVSSGNDPDITVRSSGNGQGTANLGLSARQSDPLVTLAANIAVVFGKKSSTSIFGL